MNRSSSVTNGSGMGRSVSSTLTRGRAGRLVRRRASTAGTPEVLCV